MLKRHSHDVPLALGLALLLLGYVVLLWPALSGPFLFDDFANLENLKHFSGDTQNLGKYLASYNGSPGRPISTLSFLLNDVAWPSSPESFKRTNIFIHLLNACILLALLLRLQKLSSVLPASPFWALLATAAWLCHPLQISAQMLVVQRMTLLSSTSMLAGLWAYITISYYARSWKTNLLALVVLAIATIVAILCKENGALLPVYALALNCTLLSKALQEKTPAMHRLHIAGTLIPTALLTTAIVYSGTRPYTFLSRDFNLYERALTQLHVVKDYLLQILIPRLSGSGIYFDDYPVTRSLMDSPLTVLLLLAGICIIFLTINFRKKYPLLAFAVLWFIAGHLMESTFLDLELYFEHRNYLPLLGPVIAISAWAFYDGKIKKITLMLFICWLSLLIGISGLQAKTWGSKAGISTAWAAEHPESLRANQQLTSYLLEAGHFQHAYAMQKAFINEGLPEVDYALGAMYLRCIAPTVNGKYPAIQDIASVAANSPYTNSAMQYLQIFRKLATDQVCPNIVSEADWLLLSKIFLENSKHRKLFEAFVRNERAAYFSEKFNLNATMTELESSYSIAPSVVLSQKIAEVLLSAGLVDEAEKWLKAGLKLKQPFFDTLMYDPKDRSHKLLEMIDKAKASENAMTRTTQK